MPKAAHSQTSAPTPAQSPAEPPPQIVDLGTVQLAAAPGWTFYPMQDRVIGRPADGVGGMQIVRLPRDLVPYPATHEACMSAAVNASQQDVHGPGSDRAREYGELCLAGGESFRGQGDFVRIWYRHCPDGMVAAWFAVKKSRARERGVLESMRQCDRMIATVRVPPLMA